MWQLNIKLRLLEYKSTIIHNDEVEYRKVCDHHLKHHQHGEQCTSFTRWSRIIVRLEGKEGIIESKQSTSKNSSGGVCRKSKKHSYDSIFTDKLCTGK